MNTVYTQFFIFYSHVKRWESYISVEIKAKLPITFLLSPHFNIFLFNFLILIFFISKLNEIQETFIRIQKYLSNTYLEIIFLIITFFRISFLEI